MPISRICRMASFSSSKVPKRGSGVWEGSPLSWPPWFQPTSWMALTPFLHSSPILGRSLNRMRSSSSGEVMWICSQEWGSLRPGGRLGRQAVPLFAHLGGRKRQYASCPVGLHGEKPAGQSRPQGHKGQVADGKLV